MSLEVKVAVLTERLDTMEEQAKAREELQKTMDSKLDEIVLKLSKQSGYLAGIVSVFTAIGAILYYLAGPVLQLLKWKHG